MAIWSNKERIRKSPIDTITIKSKQDLEQHLNQKINDKRIVDFFKGKNSTIETSSHELEKLKTWYTLEKVNLFLKASKKSIIEKTQDSMAGFKNNWVADIIKQWDKESRESAQWAKDFIEKAIKDPSQIWNKIEEKVEKIKDKAIEEAKEKGTQMLNEAVPGFWKITLFIEKIKKAWGAAKSTMDTQWGFWGIMSAIALLFWVLFWGKKLSENPSKDDVPVKKTPQTLPTNNKKSAKESKNTASLDINNTVDPEHYYYHAGVAALIHFSGNTFEWWSSAKPSIRKFANENIESLKEIKKTWEFKGKEIDADDKTMIKSMLSEDVTTLLKTSLNSSIVKQTLENSPQKLQQLLGEQNYTNILSLIEKWDFDYMQLPLKDISVISLFSINSFWLLTINSLKEMLKTTLGSLKESSIDFEQITQSITWKKNGIVSNSIISAFTTEYDPLKFWWNSKIHSKQDGTIRNSIWERLKHKENSQENKEQLDKLISFKNWLSSDDFLGDNSKTLLKHFGKEKKFSESLDYLWVVALYTILWGKQSLEHLTTLDYPVLYKTISFIIGSTGDKWHASWYLRDVVSYFASSDEKTPIFKNSNEKEALKIIMETWAKDTLTIIWKEVKDKLGWAWLMEDKVINDAMWILTGLSASKAGTIAMKKWAIIKGSTLKKFWLIAIFSAAASLLHTTYNAWSEFLDELWGFSKPSDPKNLSTEQLNQRIQQADDFNNRFHNVETDTEKFGIFTWKKWLEILYKNNIYKLWLEDETFDWAKNKIISLIEWGINLLNFEKGEWLWDNMPNSIQQNLKDFVKDAHTWLESEKYSIAIQGKLYDLSKIKFDKTKVILWEWKDTLSIWFKSLLSAINSDPRYPKKLLHKNEDNKNDPYYILLEWKDNSLALRKIGTIKTQA